ncbi:hypothetical protein [Vibrio vulnificus YJ016]|uniref:Uncharacterized protein n=1 Tax=Vibrio vulnificus (strain YJ016) TaxID=196600 RepID=Q7MMS9_VIBVY|nr:hypothetical protein [Vibrio vulnificus YJ016]
MEIAFWDPYQDSLISTRYWVESLVFQAQKTLQSAAFCRVASESA